MIGKDDFILELNGCRRFCLVLDDFVDGPDKVEVEL